MVEAIRNLLNQSDKSIFDVKNKLKEEKDKGLTKVQEQLPTQEEITSQVKSNVCSLETSNAVDKNFNRIKDKLNNIKDKLEKGIEKLEALKEKLAKLEPGYVNAMEGKLKTGLEAAKAKLLAAREAGDINAEVEAQKEIARIGVEESKVNTLKTRYQQQAKETVASKTLDEAIKNPATDPKAEEWAEKNPWFGQDSAMTYTAFDLHKKLTEQEGFDPNTDEYYAEVDRRMRLDFPHKFGKTETKETTKPTQTVASATRSVKPSRNTVRLTSSQVAIAKKLGVPLEEYAKQLKITKEA